MDEQSDLNKPEPPTPFKLSKAREKGSVARGMDLGFAVSLAALIGYLWMFGPRLGDNISNAAQRTLVSAVTVTTGPNEILFLVGSLLASVAQPMIFMFGVIFISVLVFEIVQTGFVFSFSPLTPNFSKLSPANGFKRVFSGRQLVETGKNIAKLLIYSVLSYIAIMQGLKLAVRGIDDAWQLAGVMQDTTLHLLVLFVGAAVVVAAIDQLISRRDFFKRMRMTRHETKRESRDREGDPRFKQRRRQVHREYAKLSKSLKNVRGADILIVNPTHYAVALRYDSRTMNAPTIVAQGADQLALRLKRLAFLYNVVTVENRELARVLYHRCEIDREIPDAYFRPVANIYRQVRSRPATTANAA
jgi:flagellar biosynthesis protein FlhB